MPDSNGLDSSLLAEFADFFPSLCTIETVGVTINPNGEPIPGAAIAVAGLSNIPCRLMPAYLKNTRSAREELRGGALEASNLKECDLMGYYYPQITAAMQATIDGTSYNIIGSVNDGNKIKTTLRLEIIGA